ncbi:MAG: DUF4271 domain-containing protein [Mucilaginibacter sp.]
MRSSFWLFLVFLFVGQGVFAQQAILPTVTHNIVDTINSQQPISVLDSVVQATRAHQKFMADSIAMQYIKYPDSAIYRAFVAQTLKQNLYTGNGFWDIPTKVKSVLKEGSIRNTRDPWLIAIIVGLLIYAAFLNITLNKDIKHVLQSFYSRRAALGKDEAYINFWSFVGFFLLFGATFGLFLYQLSSYYSKYFFISGVRLFAFLSLVVLGLSAVKFIVLKVVGFIFDINKLVAEYVSVLYLTYFNITLVFIPIVVCFSLLNAAFIPCLLVLAGALVVVIFTWLYLRSSVNIISNFRFHKFYLFIYLCALEICPILILIKALSI